MQKKREDSLLFFSLLIIIVCNNVRAMDDLPRYSVPASPAAQNKKFKHISPPPPPTGPVISVCNPASSTTKKRRPMSGSGSFSTTNTKSVSKKKQLLQNTVSLLTPARRQRSASSPMDQNTESGLEPTRLRRISSYPQFFESSERILLLETQQNMTNIKLKKQKTITDLELKVMSKKTDLKLNEQKTMLKKTDLKLNKQENETTEIKKFLETMTSVVNEMTSELEEQKKNTTKIKKFLEKIMPILYTLGTLGVAMGVDHLFRFSLTEKRSRNVKKLHQAVVDVKELEMCSFFSTPLLFTPLHPLHRIINGYNEANSIAKENVINFTGETANAFGLRYLQKPVSKFITNRFKRSKYPFVKTARLKYSECPTVKTVLKHPLFRYATIRGLWRLERFVINRAISSQSN